MKRDLTSLTPMSVFVVLSSIPGTCAADGGISAAVGAMQALAVAAMLGAGFVPLLALIAAFVARRRVTAWLRILLGLIALAYVFFAMVLFYAIDRDDMLLVLYAEAWLIVALMILVLVEGWPIRSLLLLSLVAITISVNLPYPRLLDFYTRQHVDNRGDFPFVEFERDVYWRAIGLADGRQLLVTSHPPRSLQGAQQEGSPNRSTHGEIRSPLILRQKEATDSITGFYLQVLDRTAESYITPQTIYFTLPVLGEKTVPRFSARTVGEAQLLVPGIEGLEHYLLEVMKLPADADNRARIRYWEQLLLELGADPNFVDSRYGLSLLMSAILNGRYTLAKDLIARGADIDRVDHQGRTALHFAAGAHSEFVALLLRHGANPLATDKQGNTPVDAVKRGPLGAKKRNANGQFVAHVESPRYQDGLRSLEMLEARIGESSR